MPEHSACPLTGRRYGAVSHPGHGVLAAAGGHGSGPGRSSVAPRTHVTLLPTQNVPSAHPKHTLNAPVSATVLLHFLPSYTPTILLLLHTTRNQEELRCPMPP